MINETIKKEIDKRRQLIEDIIDPSTFALNPKVKELMREIENLQKQCLHDFQDGETCIYCGFPNPDYGKTPPAAQNENDTIILYSTQTCPKCRMLETKLKQKGYDVVKEMNEEVLIKLGITSVPQVKVGDKIYDFSTDISAANEWVKNLEARNK